MKRTFQIIAISSVLTLWTVFTSYACTSIVVGKKASKDGSVLFGHNEDASGRRVVNTWFVPRMKHQPEEVIQLLGGGEIPQSEETWAFFWFQVSGLRFSDYYINEWGVNVGSDVCPSREDKPELTDGGIGFMLRRIIAERAKTAREGVEIAGDLLDRFGYASSGRTLVICDPNEGWFLSIVAGKHWVAQRVPDDGVVVLPNSYIVRQVDFDDTANFITSEDNIRDYAVRRDWYDPDSGEPFDFAYAYMEVPEPESKLLKRGYDTRQWRGQQLLTGKTVSVGEARERGPPFAGKPDRKLTVQDVMAVLRDHYEGTEYGPVREEQIVPLSLSKERSGSTGLPREILVNPNRTTERTICTRTTQFSTVAQLRSWLPISIGAVIWTSFGRPDCNVYVPWYVGITKIPEGFSNTPGVTCPVEAFKHHFDPVPGTFDYDPTAAFWIFNDLENLVDAHYPHAIEEVVPVWESFEERVFGLQESVEQNAHHFWRKKPDQARQYLTEFTISLAHETLRTTEGLTKRLKTKFYR